MKKIYEAPNMELIKLTEPLCLVRGSVGYINQTDNTQIDVDETFPINETGHPGSQTGISDDDWFNNADNWGGD